MNDSEECQKCARPLRLLKPSRTLLLPNFDLRNLLALSSKITTSPTISSLPCHFDFTFLYLSTICLDSFLLIHGESITWRRSCWECVFTAPPPSSPPSSSIVNRHCFIKIPHSDLVQIIRQTVGMYTYTHTYILYIHILKYTTFGAVLDQY